MRYTYIICRFSPIGTLVSLETHASLKRAKARLAQISLTLTNIKHMNNVSLDTATDRFVIEKRLMNALEPTMTAHQNIPNRLPCR